MDLPARLQAVAARVPPGSVVVDAGADHAVLTAYLLTSGRCPRVIATGKAPGPLARARRNLAALGAEGVELRRGDGLGPVTPAEADVVVIAGLGQTVAAILARDPGKGRRPILQPTTGAPRLRGWWAGRGFRVIDEDLAEDGGRLCDILLAEPGGPGDGRTSYPPLDAFRRCPAGVLPRTLLLAIGPLLLARDHPLLPRRLEAMVRQRERLTAAATGSMSPRGRRALAAARRQERLLRQLLGRWKGCG